MKWMEQHREDLIFCGVFLLLGMLLINLFPYSGDDWAWGCDIGLERLENHFDHYNGRYAGNLLVLALTRSRLLRNAAVALTLLLALLAARHFFGGKGCRLPLAGALLLLLIPVKISTQSIVWTSGFSNYVPPAVLILLYFALITGLFDEEPPTRRPLLGLLTLALGFLASLFIENLTLYNVAIGLLILLFAAIRFKKLCLPPMGFLVGSVLGTALMFSNSAYRAIASGTDGYRSVPGLGQLIAVVLDHLYWICDYLFYDNLPLLAVMSGLCILLGCRFLAGPASRRRKIPAAAALGIHLVTAMLILAKSRVRDWMLMVNRPHSFYRSTVLFALVILVYCLSVLALTLLCVEQRSQRFRMVLILVSVPIMAAPLLVVNPIGPRCLFGPWLMLLVYILGLLQYLMGNWQPACPGALRLTAAAAALGLFLCWYTPYMGVQAAQKARMESVRQQLEEGRDVVLLNRLPLRSYVWTGDPDEDDWILRFKLFYGIPVETDLRLK